jgi:hypothetical protein
MKEELSGALFRAVDTFDALALRYAIVGGLAVNAWAGPRATKDVDLYAELPDDRRADVRSALEARGFHVPAMVDELARFGVFRSKALDTGVFLDVFDAVGPLGDAILRGRRSLVVAGRDLWFVRAEDLAVLKAFSDRAHDFDDLVKLVRTEPPLDDSYVERWAATLDESMGGTDVRDRLARARAGAR